MIFYKKYLRKLVNKNYMAGKMILKEMNNHENAMVRLLNYFKF